MMHYQTTEQERELKNDTNNNFNSYRNEFLTYPFEIGEKKLKTRSNLTISFKPHGQKKLILKISKNCSQMSSKAFLCTSPYGQKTIFLWDGPSGFVFRGGPFLPRTAKTNLIVVRTNILVFGRMKKRKKVLGIVSTNCDFIYFLILQWAFIIKPWEKLCTIVC